MQRELDERQKASEAITLFRALIDQANDSIEVVDPETARFLDVNSTAARLHGYTREEYLKLTVFDLNPNFTPPVWNAALAELRQKGSMILETQHKRKDGSIFSIEINVSYIRLQRDYILAVHRDITERKRTEQQIRRLNRVYAVLSSVSELILRERNPQAIFEAACKIAVDTGRFRMAWIGTANEEQTVIKPVASAGVVDGYLDTINIDLKDDIRTKGPGATTLREGCHQLCNDIANDTVMRPWREEALKRGYRACGGFPLKISNRAIGIFVLYADEPNYFDSDETRLLDQLAGDIGFALESHQKEAERQRAEKDLRASEERFRLLIENSTDIITVVNRDGIIRFVSPTIKQYLGYEPRDLIGHSAFELVDPQDVDKTVGSLRAALEDPSVTANAEYRFRHRDGSWHIMQSSGRSIPNQAADGFVVINSRDITESRNLSEQLRQSQKLEAIGALAGGVAHDFNNLLTVINGRSELMLLRMDPASPLRSDVSLIHQTGERAANLTRQLLAFSRRQMLQPRIIDLNQIVNDMFKMLNRLVPENISIATILEPELLATRADPGQIEQVLINLVVNARDAMPSGGKLLIGTANLVCDEAYRAANPGIPPNNYVTLSVSDTGCGMTEQVKARIFEPFFTTKEQGKGTGLGLATVFGIIQQSKGQISVQSEPGKGTTFVIYLPQQNDADGQSSAGRSAVRTGRGETVLVAEDEKQVRTLVREVLESNGYRVLESTSGEECISICEQNQEVDLVIAAEAMPKMNGGEFSRNLRSVKPGIKLLVMAGNADHSQLKGFADLNAGSFIQKPFTAGVLIRKVSDILGP
jgi:PAS domain S-box-containing protein